MKKFILGYGFVEFKDAYLNPKDIDVIVEQAHDINGDYASKLSYVKFAIVDNYTNILGEDDSVTKYFELDRKGVVNRIIKKVRNADITLNAFDKSYADMLFKKVESALDMFTQQFADIDVEKQQENLANVLEQFKEVKEEQKEIMHG